MKASELIKRLEWFIENHGDETVAVLARVHGETDMYAVGDVDRVGDDVHYKPGEHVLLLGAKYP